jgi:hypothetical protein
MSDYSIKNFVLCGLVLVISGSIRAQEMEPRSYADVPKGLHAAALSYTFSQGNVISDFTSPVQDLNVTTSAINIGYVQTFALFKKLARVSVGMPYGFLNGSAKFYGNDTSGTRNGFFDGRIKFGVNLIGSPVLSPKEFRQYQEHTVLGVSMVVTVPIGQYYSSKLINLGTNRWGIKPELGFSHREGRLYYEMYTGVWMFTENTAFFNSTYLKEKALFSFQAHVDYIFKSNIWVAINGGFADGGETSQNGIEKNDEQQNWRLGSTLSMPLSQRQSIKFMINTGIATRAGQNYTALTLIYQYSWF